MAVTAPELHLYYNPGVVPEMAIWKIKKQQKSKLQTENEPKQSLENPLNQKYEDPKEDRGKTIKFKADL